VFRREVEINRAGRLPDGRFVNVLAIHNLLV
jgi:hypothetical protein